MISCSEALAYASEPELTSGFAPGAYGGEDFARNDLRGSGLESGANCGVQCPDHGCAGQPSKSPALRGFALNMWLVEPNQNTNPEKS